MSKNNILSQRNRIVNFIEQKRLREAFVELKHISDGAMAWEISDEIMRLEESYKLMLSYATQGADDPSRASLYDNIVSDMLLLLDRVVRQRLSQDEASLYYNAIRTERFSSSKTIASLIDEYLSLADKLSIYNIIVSDENSQQSQNSLEEKERLEREIFNRIWITFPLKSNEEELIKDIFQSKKFTQQFQELVVSALLMGMNEYYDPRRLNLLFAAYQSEIQEVSVKALVAILLSFYKYGCRISDAKLLNYFASIKELPTWSSDVKTAYLEFVRTRDTERISRKMQDELIPQMLKLRPDIYKKINDSTAMIDMSSIEENPEWEEMLNKSGITDKIKELSQLQEEGSDVFMSTFSHLKTFPFFSDIANWFLPFSLEHSLVKKTLGTDISVIGDIIENAPFLCNSDKYSFLLSLGSIPQHQRQLMLSQFEQQREALGGAGMAMASMTMPNQRKNLLNKYLQDLYRFFKLFRRKGEFNDPFANSINLVNVSLLSDDLDDVDTLTLVAEFYFRRKYYQEALDVYLSISEKIPPTAQIFQKIGYCYHQQGDIKNALINYEHAELLNADSAWTLRRIAACHKSLNNPQKALSYYERVASMNADDLAVTMNIGHCHLELENYKEAIKNYYKVEFLDEKSTRAWRPLAWCLLLSGDFDQSSGYYSKILNDNPTAEDYLNMGHLALAQSNISKAIESYKLSIDNKCTNVDWLIDSLKKDEKYLTKIGVDISLMPFIVDALLYSID
ncbi:MAG: tetratricopeptide repeat protein [Muribaculaceae bacterium]|nr:tetratricopeptide repeat protein [Muribaculaceae bacterium]